MVHSIDTENQRYPNWPRPSLKCIRSASKLSGWYDDCSFYLHESFSAKGLKLSDVNRQALSSAMKSKTPFRQAPILGTCTHALLCCLLIAIAPPRYGQEQDRASRVRSLIRSDDLLGAHASAIPPMNPESTGNTRETIDWSNTIQFLAQGSNQPKGSAQRMYGRGAAAATMGMYSEAIEYLSMAIGASQRERECGRYAMLALKVALVLEDYDAAANWTDLANGYGHPFQSSSPAIISRALRDYNEDSGNLERRLKIYQMLWPGHGVSFPGLPRIGMKFLRNSQQVCPGANDKEILNLYGFIVSNRISWTRYGEAFDWIVKADANFPKDRDLQAVLRCWLAGSMPFSIAGPVRAQNLLKTLARSFEGENCWSHSVALLAKMRWDLGQYEDALTWYEKIPVSVATDNSHRSIFCGNEERPLFEGPQGVVACLLALGEFNLALDRYHELFAAKNLEWLEPRYWQMVPKSSEVLPFLESLAELENPSDESVTRATIAALQKSRCALAMKQLESMGERAIPTLEQELQSKQTGRAKLANSLLRMIEWRRDAMELKFHGRTTEQPLFDLYLRTTPGNEELNQWSKLARSADPREAAQAASKLERHGPHSIQVIMQLLQDPIERVRISVFHGTRNVLGRDNLNSLYQRMAESDPSTDLRIRIIKHYSQDVAFSDSDRVEMVKIALYDPSTDIQTAGLNAAWSLDALAVELLPTLLSLQISSPKDNRVKSLVFKLNQP